MQIVKVEGLQQPQRLDILAAARLDHPRLHQPAQGLELGRQVPFGQRRRLIQGADLLLQQRQVVHGIEDHVLAVVAPGVARDDLTAAADHHLVDVAPDPDVAVPIGDRHRVVVGLVTHQRLRADPPGRLVAGVERRGRQVRHRLQVARQPRADRLGVAAQDVRLALAALFLEPGVEVLPGGEARQRHHEGAPRPADQPLDGALVVALAGAAVAVPDQVVRQEPAEEPRPLAGPVGQDARHQAAVVVVDRLAPAGSARGSGMTPRSFVDPRRPRCRHASAVLRSWKTSRRCHATWKTDPPCCLTLGCYRAQRVREPAL